MTAIQPPYLQLSVNYADEPELRALCRFGADGLLARDLAVGMECYCRRNLTDGWVPAEQAAIICWPLPTEHMAVLLGHLETTKVIDVKPNGFYLLRYTAKYGTRADAEERAERRRTAGAKGGRPPGKHTGQGNGKRAGLHAETERPARTREDKDKDRDREEPPPPAPPPRDEAGAWNGARGGGGGRTDLVTQVQALMASQGHPVSHEEAEVITWQLLGERDDIAHPAAYLRAAISTAERAAALVGADGQRTAPPPRSRTPSTYRPVTDLDRRIIDAFEDRLGAAISAGQATAVRESLAERGITDPGDVLSVIETERDPRELLPARKHVPGSTVAAALAVGGVRIPATEEQRAKHAADARAGIARTTAAARARLENAPEQEEHHDYQDRDLDGLDHDPADEPEPADAEPPY
jgi:hypothetical protein